MRIFDTTPYFLDISDLLEFANTPTLNKGDLIFVMGEDDVEYPARVVKINGTGKKATVVFRWLEDNEKETKSIKVCRPTTEWEIALKGDDRDKLDYLKKLWVKLNKTKFNGAMTMPNISFMRSIAVEKFRNRGYWRGGSYRQLKINRHVFKNEAALYETFLHEMCHQWTNEVKKVFNEPEKGHGPVWKATMRMVGLDPNRYDTNDNSAYMDEEQKAKHDEKQRLLNEAKQTKQPINPKDLKFGTVIQWMSSQNHQWYNSVIINPENTRKKRWYVMGEDKRTAMLVPPSLMFKADPATEARLSTPEWQVFAADVLRGREQQKLYKKKPGYTVSAMITEVEMALIRYTQPIRDALSAEDRYTMRKIMVEEIKASFKEGVTNQTDLLNKGALAAISFAKRKLGDRLTITPEGPKVSALNANYS